MANVKKALTLSIIIPAYNEENYLRTSLDSLQKQTVQPLEIIVVDNNSTDQTAAIARSYSGVRVVKEKQQGIVYARNKGFDSAKGEIIGRIDADTLLPADWVETVLDFFADPCNEGSGLTGGGYFYNIRMRRFNGWMLSQLAYRLNKFVAGHYILWGSNMAIQRKLWPEIKDKVCLRNDIHEDMDIAIHWARRGFKIKYVPELKTGVMLRRVYTDRHDLRVHMKRWPTTLHSHGYKLWWMGTLGNLFLWFIIQPTVFTAEYINRYLFRKRPLND